MKTRFNLKKIMKTSVFRLVLIVVIVIIPINILTLILSNTAVNEVQKQISQETRNALELYMSQIDGSMERAAAKIHYMSRDSVNFGRLNSKEVTDEEEYYKQLQSVVLLYKELQDAGTENSWMTGFYALFPDKDIDLVQCDYSDCADELPEYVADVAKNSPDQIGKWKVVTINEVEVVVLVAHYKNAYYGAWIELKRLAAAMELNNMDDGIIKAFTDDDGRVRYANADALEQLDLGKSYYQHNGVGYVLISAPSDDSDLNMVQIMSKGEMTKALPVMIRMLQIASVIALCIIPIIILSIKKWMIKPLNKLLSAMEKIEQGDMDIRIKEEKSGSEFEQINSNFNHMMDEVANLKIDVYEEKLEKQQIKMRFLSQQIQPHFILNAMNILYSYEQEEFPLIQKMILFLSRYFRYIVNAKSDFVELHEEMDHIRNYFEIQQARYPETFFAVVEYDEEIGDCLVPPLLIQNFAENAIKHSLKIGNQIDIFVIAQKLGENKVRIRLSDTGEGISEELVEKIERFRKTREYQDGLGVGIQNAIERLDILYGGKIAFRISREHPHGTRVEMIVPLVRDEYRKQEDI